jgi:N-acetyltransferase 10
VHLSYHDRKRLKLYSRNMVDHHIILDTLCTLARLLFQGRLTTLRLSYLQVAILLATGLHRDVDSIAHELDLLSNEAILRMERRVQTMGSLAETLEDDQNADEVSFVRKQQRELIMSTKDRSEHALLWL